MRKSDLFDRNSLSILICRNATIIKAIPPLFKNITKGKLPTKNVIFIKFPQRGETIINIMGKLRPVDVRKKSLKFMMKEHNQMFHKPRVYNQF